MYSGNFPILRGPFLRRQIARNALAAGAFSELTLLSAVPAAVSSNRDRGTFQNGSRKNATALRTASLDDAASTFVA